LKIKEVTPMKEAISSLRVVEVDPSTDLRWERFLTTQPNALIYQHPAWLQVIEEVYGDHPIHLGCFDTSGELRGLLPLCSKRRVLGGHIFSSLPYTSLAGPLADDEQIATLLVQEALARTREEPGATLSLRTLSPTLENGQMIGAPASPTYVLALPEQPDLLHFGNAKNHASIKWAVSKAAKLGVSVREAETERDLWAWYKLYAATMLDLAILPHSYRFLVGAWRHLQPKGMLRLLLAEHVEASRTRLLGGIVLLLFQQTVSYAYAGWDRSQQALQPNDALHWRAIHDAISEGFRWYDFGESALSNVGLTHFKRKWGAEPTMIYAYHYPDTPQTGTENSFRHANSRSRQIALDILRRLPTKTVDPLGNWIHTWVGF
jgi:Acetyltransferase (GNAT) domain